MESLFLDIQEAVAMGMPQLGTVDEDYGQLYTGEDSYPLSFPCVLINIPQTTWKTVSEEGALQQGKAIVNVKLCFDCYDDTHYGSGTEGKIKERMTTLTELHLLLSDLQPSCSKFTLERTVSRFYNVDGGIKVYETSYECYIEEFNDPGCCE